MRKGTNRPSPEALLKQVQMEEREEGLGKLKIFLGYASGVGKSHRMLDEGRRRRKRGQDVVVGAIQPTVSPDVQELLDQLEVVPPRQDNGSPAMDLDAILRRRPEVCIIDGLAYDNPPGCRHEYRWQDVEEILSAGISVVTSLNLQYIQEHRARVEELTGKKVATTVPLSFIHGADEIEIVDAPAEMISQPGTLPAPVGGPSHQQKLQALREIALLLAADVVDRQLQNYLERQGLHSEWGTQERILVGITPKSDASTIIESGQRNANRFHGELYVVYVRQPELNASDQQALDRNLQVAREAGARIHVLEGEDPVEAIVDFARSHSITQIFIGHSKRENWRSRWFGDPVDRLIRSARGIDIQVFPHTGNR
jgi:two-component system, OmpR family, sensor histidine kinase KdpD